MNRNRNRNDKDNRGGRREKRYDGDKAKVSPKSRKPRKSSKDREELESEGMDNNPNWYFTDKMLAEQVSQLSFQQIAGIQTATRNGTVLPTANICRINLNPCPGVQQGQSYNPGQRSAINQAGFKLYSMLSAYTGRSAVYGPQDLSIMILYMGEVISMTEYLRRAFGCTFVWSERDRSYPKQVIKAMGIDPDDLMRNYSDYRTRFNAIVQRINQIPIPQGIAYFDKCASLYEKVYKDSPSAMGSLIFMAPYTTWRLDETSDTRGTKLVTTTWLYDKTGQPTTNTTMGQFLVDLDFMVNDLLNSSTLNVVYTDLLNLATKMSVQFWKFDYLSEGYIVVPEYNENFLLQFHNMSTAFAPTLPTEATVGTRTFTEYNDVISDAANNQLLYDPGFADGTYQVLPTHTLCDLTTDAPTVETRIESLRFTSLWSYGWYDDGTTQWHVDCALPDHYVVNINTFDPSGALDTMITHLDTTGWSAANYSHVLTSLSKFYDIDWAPRFYSTAYWYTLSAGNKVYMQTGEINLGDLNFWTWVDFEYLAKIIDFVGIALYSIR